MVIFHLLTHCHSGWCPSWKQEWEGAGDEGAEDSVWGATGQRSNERWMLLERNALWRRNQMERLDRTSCTTSFSWG